MQSHAQKLLAYRPPSWQQKSIIEAQKLGPAPRAPVLHFADRNHGFRRCFGAVQRFDVGGKDGVSQKVNRSRERLSAHIPAECGVSEPQHTYQTSAHSHHQMLLERN